MRSDHDEVCLLAAVVEKSDPEAFAALVARLGPPVLRICRTILFDAHLAEDAFQSTFLTLYQKAGSIEDPMALRSWVCGTAYKIASRLRSRSIRLARHENSGDMDQAEGRVESTNVSDHDLFLAVRKELDRLPDKYRAPLILCYLEGLTHEQAASQLGWAVGTVKVRLVRGRRLLRERLDRRKIALAAGLLLLWRREAGAAPPQMVDPSAFSSASHPGHSDCVEDRWGLDRRFIGRLVLAFALLCAVVSAARSMAFEGPPPEDPESAHLPANLTDILNSDCS